MNAVAIILPERGAQCDPTPDLPTQRRRVSFQLGVVYGTGECPKRTQTLRVLNDIGVATEGTRVFYQYVI